MRFTSLFSASIAITTVLAVDIAATPHDSYSSSVGVLGCHVNTNRIAYWPMAVDCNNICVKVSHGGRSVFLLRVDQSQGAYDISYDAWNYLYTGKGAEERPVQDGPIPMQYENVDAGNCLSLINTRNKKLPLSASNSMNFLTGCLAQPESWVARNHVLYNILDPICLWGHNEECTLNMAESNQPKCKHQLGVPTRQTDVQVWDIEFGTGKKKLAGGLLYKSRAVRSIRKQHGRREFLPTVPLGLAVLLNAAR